MNRARKPRVGAATFLAIAGAEGPIHIEVTGEDFVARAMPLAARLGEQVVQDVVLRADGTGFAGILERVPRDGDRLYVGYIDDELAATDVLYRSGVG